MPTTRPQLLAEVDRRFTARVQPDIDPADAAEAMLLYIAEEISRGTRLAAMTRHMLGLFQGVPGARRWRQILTVDAVRPGAGVETVRAALAAVVARPPARPVAGDTAPSAALAMA